jgi:hypothetical protein
VLLGCGAGCSKEQWTQAGAGSTVLASTQVLVSGTIYCISSGALTLLNKEVLAHYNYHAVYSLLMFHCALAVLFVHAAVMLGLATIEPLTVQVIRLWLPVNVIFVGMLATNFYALQTVGVGMVSVGVGMVSPARRRHGHVMWGGAGGARTPALLQQLARRRRTPPWPGLRAAPAAGRARLISPPA